MTLGLLFWILMVLWFFLGPWRSFPARGAPRAAWVPAGGSLLLFVLLFLVGWQVFGFIIQK